MTHWPTLWHRVWAAGGVSLLAQQTTVKASAGIQTGNHPILVCVWLSETRIKFQSDIWNIWTGNDITAELVPRSLVYEYKCYFFCFFFSPLGDLFRAALLVWIEEMPSPADLWPQQCECNFPAVKQWHRRGRKTSRVFGDDRSHSSIICSDGGSAPPGLYAGVLSELWTGVNVNTDSQGQITISGAINWQYCSTLLSQSTEYCDLSI